MCSYRLVTTFTISSKLNIMCYPVITSVCRYFDLKKINILQVIPKSLISGSFLLSKGCCLYWNVILLLNAYIRININKNNSLQCNQWQTSSHKYLYDSGVCASNIVLSVSFPLCGVCLPTFYILHLVSIRSEIN